MNLIVSIILLAAMAFVGESGPIISLKGIFKTGEQSGLPAPPLTTSHLVSGNVQGSPLTTSAIVSENVGRTYYDKPNSNYYDATFDYDTGYSNDYGNYYYSGFDSSRGKSISSDVFDGIQRNGYRQKGKKQRRSNLSQNDPSQMREIISGIQKDVFRQQESIRQRSDVFSHNVKSQLSEIVSGIRKDIYGQEGNKQITSNIFNQAQVPNSQITEITGQASNIKPVISNVPSNKKSHLSEIISGIQKDIYGQQQQQHNQQLQPKQHQQQQLQQQQQQRQQQQQQQRQQQKQQQQQQQRQQQQQQQQQQLQQQLHHQQQQQHQLQQQQRQQHPQQQQHQQHHHQQQQPQQQQQQQQQIRNSRNQKSQLSDIISGIQKDIYGQGRNLKRKTPTTNSDPRKQTEFSVSMTTDDDKHSVTGNITENIFKDKINNQNIKENETHHKVPETSEFTKDKETFSETSEVTEGNTNEAEDIQKETGIGIRRF